MGLNAVDEPDEAAAFTERHGWDWPQIPDPDRALARSLGADYQPHVFLLDAEGKVVAEHRGGGEAADWEALLGALERRR